MHSKRQSATIHDLMIDEALPCARKDCFISYLTDMTTLPPLHHSSSRDIALVYINHTTNDRSVFLDNKQDRYILIYNILRVCTWYPCLHHVIIILLLLYYYYRYTHPSTLPVCDPSLPPAGESCDTAAYFILV